MRLVLAVALTLLAACGGKVDGAAVDGAAGAPSDSFPVVGGRCVGAHGEIVRDACMLTEVADFTPRRWAPPSPRLGACSSAQIDAFQQKCLSADSDQLQEGTCAAFQQSAENAVCLSCLVTPDTAASFGPVIVHSLSPRFEVNEGGCVALALGDSSANGCGANLQALRQCTAAACAGCAGTPDAVRSDGCLCETAAQGGACKTYVGPASCVTPYVKAGDPDINGCVGGVYFLVARYFCLAH